MDFVIERVGLSDWKRGKAIRLRALADYPDAFLNTLEKEVQFSDQDWIWRVERNGTAPLDSVFSTFPEAEMSSIELPRMVMPSQTASAPLGLNVIASALIRAAIANPALRIDEQFFADLGKSNPRMANLLRNANESEWKKAEALDSIVSKQLR